MKLKRILKTFQFKLLLSFLITIFFSTLTIILYTYHANKTSMLELSTQLASEMNNEIIEKTTSFLLPASNMAVFSSRLIENGIINPDDFANLEEFSIQVLKSNDQLAMFNIGDNHGNFLMPKKLDNNTIATKIIRKRQGEVIWKYRDVKGNITSIDFSEYDGYDPRVRPWYIGAKTSGKTFWTDVYIFFTDKMPGITAGYPVYTKSGDFWGVFSLDIEIGELSEFLKRVKKGENTLISIFTDKSQVVAYHDPDKVVIQEGDKYRTANIDELESDVFAHAYKTFLKTDKNNFKFNYENKNYMAFFNSFPDTFDKDWNIGIIYLEDDLIGGIRNSFRTNMIILGFITLIILLVALYISNKITTPLKDLVIGVDNLAKGDLETEVKVGNYPELEELGKNFNIMVKRVKESQELAVENARKYEAEKQIKSKLIISEKLTSFAKLVGGIAHEVNSPLAASLTNIQMLKDEIQEDHCSEKKIYLLNEIIEIETSLKKTGEIIGQLLKYSQTNHKTEIINLKTLVTNVKLAHEKELSSKNIILEIDAKEDIMILANNTDLIQVFTSLLTNSKEAVLKSNKDNKHIFIKIEKKSGRAIVNVIDNGVGIDKDIETKVFDPFFSTKDIGEGIGLGLSLAYEVLRKHDAEIKIDSKPNEFTDITIIFNCYRD